MKQCKGCLATQDRWDGNYSTECSVHKLARLKKFSSIHLQGCPCQECVVKMMCIGVCVPHTDFADSLSKRYDKGLL